MDQLGLGETANIAAVVRIFNVREMSTIVNREFRCPHLKFLPSTFIIFYADLIFFHAYTISTVILPLMNLSVTFSRWILNIRCTVMLHHSLALPAVISVISVVTITKWYQKPIELANLQIVCISLRFAPLLWITLRCFRTVILWLNNVNSTKLCKLHCVTYLV